HSWSYRLSSLRYALFLRTKYSVISFYTHYLDGFDSFFIIKCLSLFNKTKQRIDNPYYFVIKTRDNVVLRLIIKQVGDQEDLVRQ
ncbi:hypothetical protein, partial [Enterococcus faecalis]|uniref:hypothetical protein n=1 Tax=Enterococcus faecalis TaxID=1351 RepID=UPI003D6C21D5